MAEGGRVWLWGGVSDSGHDIEGLPQPSVVNFDNVHVIAKARVGGRIGSLDVARVLEVKRALGYALDWPELKVL